MMTPERTKPLPEDVRRMLAAARPDQIQRLLDDIRRIPATEAARYDA
ncbi:hypothetical protein [Cognatiyoonia sp. IB215182]|nr:hypothetical protein [Cognatiyoonia sp. IB215182]MDX8354643.1 hypothetical protein [Cognatiyoonia sp. IB215182]